MNENSSLFKGTLSWWSLIRANTNGIDRYSGDRAELRRCHSISDVVYLPVYHTLLEKTGVSYENTEQLRSLAAVAWVLSWVSTESSIPFAEALATNDPIFQPIRFRRLLECIEYDELAIQLIRALRYTKRTANVPDLIKSVLDWNHGSFIKEKWALAYYRIAKKE